MATVGGLNSRNLFFNRQQREFAAKPWIVKMK